MSSLEGNKIAAAILVGGMITLSVGIVTDFIYRPHRGAEATHAGGEGGAAPAAKQPAPLEPILGLIANADVAKGETIAKKCQTCHTFDPSGANKVGPGLYGVVGRVAGTHEGFAYSDPMKAHNKPWTFADLNHFIARPKEFIPGTKMSFPGIPGAQERADLLAWLNQQSAKPAPMPTPDEIAAEEAALKAEQPAEGAAPAEAPAGEQAAAPAEGQQPAAEGGQNAVAMIASADPAAGEKVAAKCKACHDLSKDGKNKVGPHLWGIVGRNHAAVEGFAYSDVMKSMADKPWTFEDLDKFLAKPKEYAPGTKMSFPGLPKPEDRAALLRWLHDQSDSPVPLPAAAEGQGAAVEQPASPEAAPATEPAAASTAEAGGGEAAAPATQTEQAAPAPAEQTAAAPAGDNAVAMLASADPAKGEKVAAKCKACHDLSKAAKNKVGPALWGVVGRNHAAVEGFAYSDVMKGMADKPWSFEDLDHFLAKPKDYAPGTKMAFPGLPKAEDRAALLRWLRDQSDSPVPLPQ